MIRRLIAVLLFLTLIVGVCSCGKQSSGDTITAIKDFIIPFVPDCKEDEKNVDSSIYMEHGYSPMRKLVSQGDWLYFWNSSFSVENYSVMDFMTISKVNINDFSSDKVIEIYDSNVAAQSFDNVTRRTAKSFSVIGDYIYWCDGLSADIWRIRTDGKQLKRIASERIPSDVSYYGSQGNDFYIDNGWLYYTTIAKKHADASNYKIIGTLMRTKLDGSGTQTIAELPSSNTGNEFPYIFLGAYEGGELGIKELGISGTLAALVLDNSKLLIIDLSKDNVSNEFDLGYEYEYEIEDVITGVNVNDSLYMIRARTDGIYMYSYKDEPNQKINTDSFATNMYYNQADGYLYYSNGSTCWYRTHIDGSGWEQLDWFCKLEYDENVQSRP